MSEKIIYTPCKLRESLRKRMNRDVKDGVYVNINAVVEERLLQSYGMEFEKRVRLSTLGIGEKFMFAKNKTHDSRIWEVVKGCSKRVRLCKTDGRAEYKSCRAVVVKV